MQKPPSVIRGRRSRSGRLIPPRSACCGKRLVFFSPLTCRFERWLDYPGDPMPAELRCEWCNRVCIVAPPKGKT
jgi:hypothetical protein